MVRPTGISLLIKKNCQQGINTSGWDYHKEMPYLYEHFFGVYPSDILFAHSSEPVCLKAKDEMIHLTLNDWSQGKH